MFARLRKTMFRFFRYDDGRTLIEYVMLSLFLTLAFLTVMTYLGQSASQF